MAPKPNKLLGPPGDSDIRLGPPVKGLGDGVGPAGKQTLGGNTEYHDVPIYLICKSNNLLPILGTLLTPAIFRA